VSKQAGKKVSIPEWGMRSNGTLCRQVNGVLAPSEHHSSDCVQINY